jgi:hypothetical protein
MISGKSLGVWGCRVGITVSILSAWVVAGAGGAPASTAHHQGRTAAHRAVEAGEHHKVQRVKHKPKQKSMKQAAAPAITASGRPRRWHPGLAIAFHIAGRQVPGQ